MLNNCTSVHYELLCLVKGIDMKFKAVIMAGLMLASMSSMASVNVTGKVTRIYPNQGTSTNISFRISSNSCISGNQYFTFNREAGNGAAYFAMLLSAASTSRDITVNVSSCNSSGNIPIRYIFQDF